MWKNVHNENISIVLSASLLCICGENDKNAYVKKSRLCPIFIFVAIPIMNEETKNCNGNIKKKSDLNQVRIQVF